MVEQYDEVQFSHSLSLSGIMESWLIGHTYSSILCNALDTVEHSSCRLDLKVLSLEPLLHKEVRGGSRALARLWHREFGWEACWTLTRPQQLKLVLAGVRGLDTLQAQLTFPSPTK